MTFRNTGTVTHLKYRGKMLNATQTKLYENITFFLADFVSKRIEGTSDNNRQEIDVDFGKQWRDVNAQLSPGLFEYLNTSGEYSVK